MNRIFVRSAEGFTVPREPPEEGNVGPGGEWVAESPYYLRALDEGGLERADPPVSEDPPAAAPEPGRGGGKGGQK